jgi:hypothetical protein
MNEPNVHTGIATSNQLCELTAHAHALVVTVEKCDDDTTTPFD